MFLLDDVFLELGNQSWNGKLSQPPSTKKNEQVRILMTHQENIGRHFNELEYSQQCQINLAYLLIFHHVSTPNNLCCWWSRVHWTGATTCLNIVHRISLVIHLLLQLYEELVWLAVAGHGSCNKVNNSPTELNLLLQRSRHLQAQNDQIVKML